MAEALQQAISHHQAGRHQDAERLYRAIRQEQPQHPDANHNLGVLAVQLGQPAAALPHFRTALEASPHQGQYWLSYVEALLRAGQVDDARRVLEQGTRQGLRGDAVEELANRLQFPAKTTTEQPDEIDRAIACREAGRYNEAAHILQNRVDGNPRDARAYALLAQVLSLDKQDESAWEALNAALSINPGMPVVQCNYARLLLKQQRGEDALAAARKACQGAEANLESQLVLAAALGANNQSEQALQLVNHVLQIRPDYAEALATRAMFTLRGGDSAAALADAEKALSIKPHLVQLWGLVGSLRYQRQDLQGAINALEKALGHEPDNAGYMVNLGEFKRQAGAVEAAIVLLEKAVVIAPANAGAWANLGTALQEVGRTTEAKVAYARAREIAPGQAEVISNLGVLAKEEGDWEDALHYFSQALEVRPDFAEVHNNLAGIYLNLGRLDEAEASCRRALDIRPDFAEAHSNLGAALYKLGRHNEAAQSYRRAMEINPNHAEVHNNLGNVLRDLGRHDEAEASYRRALQIKADYANAWNNLGNALKDLGRLDEAEASYRRALQIAPDYAEAHNNLGNVLKDCGRLDAAMECYRRALEIRPDHAEAHSNLLFCHNYRSAAPLAELLAEACRFGESAARQACPYTNWENLPEPDRRLRVGLVSGDMRTHPVGYFIEGALKSLTSNFADQLELIGYASHFRSDTLTERIKSCCDGWRSVVGMSDENLARQIRDDGIDILLDLSGHTAHNRLSMFARKPAPVQVSWLGYFATTGLAQMDYVLGDPHVTPPEEENNFTERVWRMPETYLCFSVPEVDVPLNPLPALNNGYVTFGCFNNLAKMNEVVVTLWARVLQAVPQSRLFLKTRQLQDASVRQDVIERFAVNGIDADRLILEGFSPRAELLASYHRVDIALDPFPYPGGTTSVESLWMGVPVLTKRGDRFLSHVGETIAHNAGLSDWIAADEEDYVAKAAGFTNDHERLAGLRAGLREQVLASPLFDADRFARHFEAAMRGMWKRSLERNGEKLS